MMSCLVWPGRGAKRSTGWPMTVLPAGNSLTSTAGLISICAIVPLISTGATTLWPIPPLRTSFATGKFDSVKMPVVFGGDDSTLSVEQAALGDRDLPLDLDRGPVLDRDMASLRFPDVLRHGLRLAFLAGLLDPRDVVARVDPDQAPVLGFDTGVDLDLVALV